jgi:hypothetical protein
MFYNKNFVLNLINLSTENGAIIHTYTQHLLNFATMAKVRESRDMERLLFFIFFWVLFESLSVWIPQVTKHLYNVIRRANFLMFKPEY